MARVKLFANFREAAGVREVSVEAETVAEVLEKLAEMFPTLRELMFEGRELKSYVNIMVNGRHAKLDQKIGKDDEVAVFPPVSGG